MFHRKARPRKGNNEGWKIDICREWRAYKDTGLTPKQVSMLKEDALGDDWGDCDTCFYRKDNPEGGFAIDYICKTPACGGTKWQWRGFKEGEASQ